MKKPRFSRVELCLYFLLTKGITVATPKQIHKIGTEAAEYFDKHLPPGFFKAKQAIFKKHGFTEKSWAEVLRQSGSFYFVPSEAINKANQEIRELCSNYLVTNGINHLNNYTNAVIGNKVRVNKVIKVDKSLYRLPETTINTIAMYLKLQKFI